MAIPKKRKVLTLVKRKPQRLKTLHSVFTKSKSTRRRV